MFTGTFKNNDCIFLLKDLSDTAKYVSLEEKEALIASGVNYSEVITRESPISDEVIELFKREVNNNAELLSNYIQVLANKIYNNYPGDIVLVSLARAGSPIGALLRRCYAANGIIVPHYSLSIIRDKGIDENALNYIRERHPDRSIVFVDGWTGKGSITHELEKSIREYNKKYDTNISEALAVIADPAYVTYLAATHADICVPNACLNSTISGLVSRTILNAEYVSEDDFHGAVIYPELADQDMTNYFLDKVSQYFEHSLYPCYTCYRRTYNMTSTVPDYTIAEVMETFGVCSRDKIKLSIGESSRALIRRKPKLLLLNPDSCGVEFLKHMAKVKEVPIVGFKSNFYNAITILE